MVIFRYMDIDREKSEWVVATFNILHPYTAFNSTQEMIYFTADLHLNHHNIIRYCNRPFSNTQDMNNALMDNWNNIVAPKDLIFILGDFCFGGLSRYSRLFNGHKVFIKGNHDDCNMLNSLLCKIDGLNIFMIHRPFAQELPPLIDIILCGHIHNKWQTSKRETKPLINVGVDVWDYKPVSLNQVLNLTHPIEETCATLRVL